MRRRIGASCVIVALACAASCTERVGDDPDGYAIGKPEHPAMVDAPSALPRALPPAHGSTLPPDHPPIPQGAAGAPPRSTGATVASDGSMQVLGLRFEVPEGWVTEPPGSSMRLAQFRLPRADGDDDDGLVTVTSAAGSVEENIRRWAGQVQGGTGPEVEDRSSGELGIHVVAIEGTYSDSMSRDNPGPRPDHKLYAAIVQARGGQLFFKGVGPKATIDRWRESFDGMVASFRDAE